MRVAQVTHVKTGVTQGLQTENSAQLDQGGVITVQFLSVKCLLTPGRTLCLAYWAPFFCTYNDGGLVAAVPYGVLESQSLKT